MSAELRLRQRFQQRLLTWYRQHRRDLPWRRTRDPYKVLVSEIMLQQTQVERVIPKYHEFLTKYPTLTALAQAPLQEVKRTWYPLGYNIRPVYLRGIAREALARYDGRLPADENALRALKGIGRYTAGALLAFAFGKDAPVLDTNVKRVLGRVFFGPRRLKRLKGQRVLWELAAALVPPGRAYDFNQALMDFGATWCTPRTPRCLPCPMKSFCRSYPIIPSEGGKAPLHSPSARALSGLAPREPLRVPNLPPRFRRRGRRPPPNPPPRIAPAKPALGPRLRGQSPRSITAK